MISVGRGGGGEKNQRITQGKLNASVIESLSCLRNDFIISYIICTQICTDNAPIRIVVLPVYRFRVRNPCNGGEKRIESLKNTGILYLCVGGETVECLLTANIFSLFPRGLGEIPC